MKHQMINWLRRSIKRLDDFSEKHVVQKAQLGEREAFGELYEKYIDGIYRYIFFRVNRDRVVAEDLTEAVFLKAWKAVEHFDNEKGTFRAWLYKIAHNVVIDHYRMQTHALRIQEETQDLSSAINLEEQFAREEDMQQVLTALKELTKEQAEVITMRFVEELSHQEIAHILNKHTDAVRALQYRALVRLRGVLEDYEHTR